MISKKQTILYGISIVGILIAYLITASSGFLNFNETIAYGNSDQFDKFRGIEKTDKGEVVVVLTPWDYDDGELVIRLRLDTHSVNNLHTYDLKKIIELEVGDQKISPSSVPRLGGHHNSGNLEFKLDQLPDQFKIKISNLNKPGIREFSWP